MRKWWRKVIIIPTVLGLTLAMFLPLLQASTANAFDFTSVKAIQQNVAWRILDGCFGPNSSYTGQHTLSAASGTLWTNTPASWSWGYSAQTANFTFDKVFGSVSSNNTFTLFMKDSSGDLAATDSADISSLAGIKNGWYDSCYDLQHDPHILQAAFAALGVTDYATALCGLGYMQSSSNTVTAQESKCPTNNFVYQGKDPNTGDKNTEVFVLSSLNKSYIDTLLPASQRMSNGALNYAAGMTRMSALGCQQTTTNPGGWNAVWMQDWNGQNLIAEQWMCPSGIHPVPAVDGGSDGKTISQDAIDFLTFFNPSLVSQCSNWQVNYSSQSDCILSASNQQVQNNTTTGQCATTANNGAPFDDTTQISYTLYGPQGSSNLQATERQACVAGTNNQSNATYCTTTYQNDSTGKLVAACQVGQSLTDANAPTTQPGGGSGTGTGVDCTANPSDPSCIDQACNANASGFGWFMCPLVDGIQGAVNAIMNFIDSEMQYHGFTQTVTINGQTQNPVMRVWQAFLPIANIAFAIVFMIIIYSTATSTGMTNYDVKKILPRLVIGAILVNISFYICAALVDLSNIIGVGAKGIFDGITGQISGSISGTSGVVGAIFGGIFGTVFGIIAGVIGIVVILLNIGTVLLAVLMVLILLAFRSVLITILVVISPIAFALWLLPNTKKWFDKWLQEFLRMLFIYPAMMAVWGASNLVVAMLIQGPTTQTNALMRFIMACLVAAMPAIAIIPLFKMGGQALGALEGLTRKGLDAMGGSKLREMDKQNRELAGAKLGSAFRGAATRGVTASKKASDEANTKLSAAEKAHTEALDKTAKADRYSELLRRNVQNHNLNADEMSEFQQLGQEITGAGGMAAYRASANIAKTSQQLSDARKAASAAHQTYMRKSNGLLNRAVFASATRRQTLANVKHENELAEQDNLGRRLMTDEGFRRGYSGVSGAMDEDTANAREFRALNQAESIGNKQNSEEREQFASFLQNVPVTEENGTTVGTPRALSNAMAQQLITDHNYKVKLSNGRELSWKSMTDNEKLTLFQQASGGSAPEVAQLRDAVASFSDPAARQAAANMVIQSGNKDFLVQGANNANYGGGVAGTHTDQVIAITKAPLEANTLDKYAKPAFWDATIDGIAGSDGVAARAANGDANAKASLNNLQIAIEAQMTRPGAAQYIQGAGEAYRRILQANGMKDADIQALFTKGGASASMITAAFQDSNYGKYPA